MIAVASVLSPAQTGQAYRFRRTVDGHKVDDVFRRRSGGSDHLAVGGQTVRVRRDCDDRVRRFVRDDAVAVFRRVSAEYHDAALPVGTARHAGTDVYPVGAAA